MYHFFCCEGLFAMKMVDGFPTAFCFSPRTGDLLLLFSWRFEVADTIKDVDPMRSKAWSLLPTS